MSDAMDYTLGFANMAANTGMQFATNRLNTKNTWRMWDSQREFYWQQQQAAKAVNEYFMDKQMAYNDSQLQRRMKDAELAGVNKYMALDMGSMPTASGSTSPSVGGMSAPSMPLMQAPQFTDLFGNLQMLANIDKTKAETETLIPAQADSQSALARVYNAQAVGQSIQNTLAEMEVPTKQANLLLDLTQKLASIDLTNEQALHTHFEAIGRFYKNKFIDWSPELLQRWMEAVVFEVETKPNIFGVPINPKVLRTWKDECFGLLKEIIKEVPKMSAELGSDLIDSGVDAVKRNGKMLLDKGKDLWSGAKKWVFGNNDDSEESDDSELPPGVFIDEETGEPYYFDEFGNKVSVDGGY